MKCHSCHNEPATVGLLCRTCVDKNCAKASQRKENTIKQIRAASTNDSLMHRAAMSWEFKVAMIAGFFAVCFVIIATTGQSAHADFVTKLLLTSFITSTMVTMASYLWLWLSMYGSAAAGQGVTMILLYFIFPGAVWRWAGQHLEQTWSTLLIHGVSLIIGTSAFFLLAAHLNMSSLEVLEMIARRPEAGDRYQATVWSE